MGKLSGDQRRALAEFLANFAVAWLAVGIITPAIIGQEVSTLVKGAAVSLFWAGISLLVMLVLTGRGLK